MCTVVQCADGATMAGVQMERALQVDIFSLAVIMYELLMMTPMVCLVSRSGTDGELVSYANCVALGYRESFKKTWPDAVQVFFSK